ncbi:MAG: tyrosine-type recombinase/integrase [Methyloceanibacter sp.]
MGRQNLTPNIAAVSGAPARKAAPSTNTLEWLLARYRETTAWTNLSAATRRRRENIFKSVFETAGRESYTHITTSTIESGRDRRAKTPHQARHFLDAMRGLFRWAYEARLVKVDPTAGVHNLPRKRTEGFIPWTEEHAAAYEARWPIGTRQRVRLDVLLYTGLRRGDAVRLGRQHVRGGSIKTEKSGYMIEVPAFILPVLQKTLDAGPTGDLTFIVGANGRPLTKESFGNEFKAACKEAGVPGSAHGVRKLAATRMADNGATEAQLVAVFGWTDPKMAAHYTRTANRRHLAAQSIEKLNASGTSIPAPLHPVRAKEGKSK